MFRRPNGRMSFSFGRMITNAVPNFANDLGSYELTMDEKEAIFKWQMCQPQPLKLHYQSLMLGNIVAHESQAKKVHASLVKAGILSDADSSLHTDQITKRLPNQLAIIAIHAQRRLVHLLFAWEEEILRSQLLDLQEMEAKENIAACEACGQPARAEDRVQIEGVERRRRISPKARMVDLRRGSAPPPYIG